MLLPDKEMTRMPWSLNSEDVVKQLQVDPKTGLSPAEASERLAEFGPNKIESARRINPLLILFNQFTSPLILLLIVAAGLSFFFKDWLDAVAILIVIIINAFIGFLMELQAEKSIEALRKLTTVNARVLRDGHLSEISSEQVVPGDILFVEGGDVITADLRIIKSSQVQTDESALTGESLPVQKYIDALERDTPLAERSNMFYKGTFVTSGNAYAIATHTGMATELGAIARMVQQANHTGTPLEKKIRQFSKKLILVTLALILIIFTAGILNGQNFTLMLQTSIALAVAAIPEGLPIVSTLALAFGVLRMARYHVIVKKLSSVETLGGTSVICTDKTGTLTQNQIAASFIEIHEGSSAMQVNTSKEIIVLKDDDRITGAEAWHQIQCIAALCNTASWHKEEDREMESGDPLEISLLKMVYCSGKKPDEYKRDYPKVSEIPFSSNAKIMGTLHANEQDYYIAAKGAIEELIGSCSTVLEGNDLVTLTEEKKSAWLSRAESKAQSGLRILAFAFRNSREPESNFLHHLTLAGFIGFIDPLRSEVSTAIKECRSAGIKVVMITGDHPATARNVALQLGLSTGQDAEIVHGRSMKMFTDLTETDKKQWLNAQVFARVNPEQKLDLVKLFQEKKMIVAMTGDGVNDAPALRKADIGIAMGQRGTQVAQEVADMILKDDAFSSIVLAIKQGRIIFDNIRKFVIYLLSCNLSELLIIATASVLNLPFRLFPLQILFINLITDVLPALALGVTEAAPHIMHRQPYPAQAPIIDGKRWRAIFIYSGVMTLSVIATLFVCHEWLYKDAGWDAVLYNNILFYTLIFSQVLHVLNMSFEKGVPLIKTSVFRNKYVWYAVITCIFLGMLSYWIEPVRKVLKISVSSVEEWVVVAVASFLSFFIIRVLKKIRWVI